MSAESGEVALCAIWAERSGHVHLHWRAPDGRIAEEEVAFQPFAWTAEIPTGLDADACAVQTLRGGGELKHLVRFSDMEAYLALLKHGSHTASIEVIRLLEHQYLLEHRLRLFGGLRFSELRRMQVAIETDCSVAGVVSDPSRPADRILAIGMQMGERREILQLDESSDVAERALLKRFAGLIREWDPDLVEGHNLFNVDLHYLLQRGRRYRLKPAWGRFGQDARSRNSRLRVAERWLDFLRVDIPGRTVFDTFLMIQVFDITARDLLSYELNDVARRLGVSSIDGAGRTNLEGRAIALTFAEDRARLSRYLANVLREARGVAEVLLPTYLAQVQNIPILLQEACLRGTASKVETLFLEKYFHAGYSLPNTGTSGGARFEGGYSRSFETGIFRHVLHYDVASLYPSILLWLDRNPATDLLGVFTQLLSEFRRYRLEFKRRARSEEDPELRQEFDARQASYKVLINSFYGYLGFPGARFGDSTLAAEVTATGRELLKALITRFQEEGCTVLEADTDGIYVNSESDWNDPEALLERAKTVLPEGIELEFDGRYESMFCYKAKNYALYDGSRVTIRGSALRSRGIEPYLKLLTEQLIAYLLGASSESPEVRYLRIWKQLGAQGLAVEKLAKSEHLSMSPAAYARKMEQGGKPRRAALEVALTRGEPLKGGDSVAYYVQPAKKGCTAAWQRARAVEDYDAGTAPYDAKYYQKKLSDWWKRYSEFLPQAPRSDGQEEMSLEEA